MYDCTLIHRLQPVVLLDGQGFGRNMIEFGGLGKSGEDCVDRPPE